jgi:hypothetical protein
VSSLQTISTGATATVVPEVVDFTSVPSLLGVFREHGVDTIVSALFTTDGSFAQSELNMIEAALETGGQVRRFAPRGWANHVEPYVVHSPSSLCFPLLSLH